MGELLIQHTISLAHQFSEQIAGRIIFLESKDKKVGYYQKKDFEFVERPRENRNINYYDLFSIS